jgi:hypothetical protein
MDGRRLDVWVLTWCDNPAVHLLDAGEVRGSNPLAPPTKVPGHRAFSHWRADGIAG